MLDDGRAVVFVVDRVQPGTMADLPPQQRAAFEQQIADLRGLADVDALVKSLRRGMSNDEVQDLLGRPTRRRTSKQGDLEAVIETWETTESVTEVTFVGVVVVKFTSSSK